MVRPFLTMMSKLCEAAGASPLDKSELQSGTEAFAAVLYEEGAVFSGRTMAGIWLLSVGPTRAMEILDKRKAKKAAEQRPTIVNGVEVPPPPKVEAK